MKNKKAAMEMSVGTIVTIVLLMTALILGLVLVRTIFTGAIENIEGVNEAMRSEVDKLFSEDDTRKIVIYPKEVILKKGQKNRGFGLFIRNLEETAKFSYEVTAQESDCGMRILDAEKLISLNKQRTNIIIPGGNVMDNDIIVKFKIPESTAPCEIVYSIQVERDNQPYTFIDAYVTIESK